MSEFIPLPGIIKVANIERKFGSVLISDRNRVLQDGCLPFTFADAQSVSSNMALGELNALKSNEYGN